MSKIKILFAVTAVVMTATLLAGCTSNSKYNDLKKDYDIAQANLASAQREYETLKSQTDSGTLKLIADKTALEQQLTQKSQELTQANSTITTMQSRMNTILSTEKRLLFTFPYSNGYINKTFAWEISIPLKDYLNYKDKAHSSDPTGYAAMVNDTYADAILNQVAQKIKDTRSQYDLKSTDTINLAATFVQTMAFTNKDILTPPNDYPQFPLETLYVPGGDCEDTSLLLAALLKKLEYNPVIFVFEEPRHMAVGIELAAGVSSYGSFEYQAKRYAYIETTGSVNYVVGSIPDKYAGKQPGIYPVQ
jgi:outer membrane murein-binding lipoprotein Lpp